MAIHGKSGSVSVDSGSTTENDLNAWTINQNADTAETTNFDSNGAREFLAGLTDWDGSFSGHWDNTQAGNVAIGDTVDLVLELNATYSYSGSAIITGKTIDQSVDAKVDANYDFQGTGALTETLT